MKHLFSLMMLLTVTWLSPANAEVVKLVTLQYPPYQYQEEDQVKGMVVDIVNEAFKRLNMDTQIRLNAWPRSLSMVKEGQADAIFTAYKNPEREQFLDYSKTVLMPQEVVLFVSKDSTISFNGDLTSLADYRIGIVRDISYGSAFDEARKNGTFKKLSEATNLEQSVRKFQSGRIDILISNRYTALAMFKQLGLSGQFKSLDREVQSVPSYIAFSKANNLSGLRDKFDNVLQEMMSDGTYNNIVKAYSE
ncbi:amino acid ABC transporter substrate-binding protein [Hahella sp. CCB-MM4]|uniref:substrate-binding periplasmic protein n=1 Tax=Hahella sp. (strain CCB-MM4) TaxID=1926491 RepID=UPI000B9AAC11|nr:transporter substrate-binding domain-containing protein [Hahella sp. CCB-MM4]OZG71891.1 amino acid ABC transporter substrate-binding protein [Hahella sp. CCB-MM4]